MKYTLIAPSGKIMQFFVQDVAALYQTIYGGVVVTNDVLVDAIATTLA
jgi:hypothetical protein